jgi:hypothetical protein
MLLRCMAGLLKCAVADCCLLSSTGCSRTSSLAFHCLACCVTLPLCQPKSINIVVTGNTSRRLNQINSHGFNRHQHQHSWELVHSSCRHTVVAGNTSCLVASVRSYYCWCFIRFIQFIPTAAASSCCCLFSLNSRSAPCIFHAVQPAMALWYFLVVLFLTKQSSLIHSCGRLVGRSAAS